MNKKAKKAAGVPVCYLTPEELGAVVKALRDMESAQNLLDVQGGYDRNPLTAQQLDEAALRVLNAARKAFWHAIQNQEPMIWLTLAAPMMVPVETMQPPNELFKRSVK